MNEFAQEVIKHKEGAERERGRDGGTQQHLSVVDEGEEEEDV